MLFPVFLWLLFLLLPGAFAFDFAGYLLHRSLHWMPWPWFRMAHSLHHHLLYPPDRFLAAAPYRSVGDVWRFLLAGSLSASALLAALPVKVALFFVAELAAYSFANEYLHDAFHVEGHPLERHAWFLKLRERHRRHHEDVGKNFGIFSFFFDRLFGTFVPGRSL